MNTQIYTLKQFSQKIGVSTRTLQRWDTLGILKARRTPTNRRFYTDEEYGAYLKKSERPAVPPESSTL